MEPRFLSPEKAEGTCRCQVAQQGCFFPAYLGVFHLCLPQRDFFFFFLISKALPKSVLEGAVLAGRHEACYECPWNLPSAIFHKFRQNCQELHKGFRAMRFKHLILHPYRNRPAAQCFSRRRHGPAHSPAYPPSTKTAPLRYFSCCIAPPIDH